MTWASRRRFLYIFGVVMFFALVLGVPLAMWWYAPPSCTDGKMNGGESAVDRGGPCPLLDTRVLIPHAIQWTRAFPVRDGTWNAVAYVENPNSDGGVRMVPYTFRLYDARNVLIAERAGATFIMPNAVTPVFEGAIDTGNRLVGRAYFEFRAPLVWERMRDTSRVIDVTGKALVGVDTEPRLTAIAENTSVVEVRNARFVAVIFDPNGNAIAGSMTEVPLLAPGERREIVFTWPDPLTGPSGRIDVTPLRVPELASPGQGFF